MNAKLRKPPVLKCGSLGIRTSFENNCYREKEREMLYMSHLRSLHWKAITYVGKVNKKTKFTDSTQI